MCYYTKLTFCICERDFPGGSVVKNLPAMQDMWVPSLGRTLQPTPVFLPGKFHGQRSPVGYSL